MFYAKQNPENSLLWFVASDDTKGNEVMECDSCNEPYIFKSEAQAKHCAEHLNTRALIRAMQEQLTEITLILSELVDNLPDNFGENTENNGGL